MNYCPGCGTANRDGSRFCNECGHKLPSKTGIICPMCSHMNPAANVYCDNCKARLVPLAPASQSAAASTPAASPQSAAPIKKGLSLPTKPADEPAPPEAEPSPDEPDWLVRLRAAAPKASELKAAERALESQPEPQLSSSDEIPDWMKPAEAEAPDWFQRLSEPASSQPVQPSPSQPPSVPADLPDWMKELGLGPQPEPPASDWQAAAPAASEPEPAVETPDWLNALGAVPAAEAEPAPGDALPDWLHQMKTEAAPPPASAAEAEPDWLQGLRRESLDAEPASTEQAPDWLATLHEQVDELTPAEAPDWMAAMRTEPPAEAAPAEETPDWLSVLREEPAAAPKAEAETPAWLSQLSPEAEAPAQAEQAPDWLMRMSAPEAEPPVPAAPDEGVPDWLRSIDAGQPAAPEAPISAFVGQDVSAEEPVAVPDWLSDAAKPAPPMAQEPLTLAPAEVPTWLRELGPMPAAAPRSEETPFGEAPAAMPGEIPEWLSGMKPGQAAPAFADESGRLFPSETETAETELAAATIPSWLQALRPPEVAGPGVAVVEGFVETEGILAGLKNVLPPAEMMGKPQGMAAVRHPEIPAADLARAGVFSELLTRGALAPTVVRPKQAARSRLMLRVTRWAVALILLFAAILPSYDDLMSSFIKLDSIDPGVYRSAYDAIEQSQAGRVLIVFDYEAFQSREMDWIARAVLTHLDRRGAQVTIVSLNPAGPALAGSLLSRLGPDVADVVSSAPAYYPGQAVGAQRALLAHPVDQVVVLAGSADSLRWWVEQAAAAGLQTPIVAGLSAGALSQSQPYLASGQVRGSVTGLMGGLSYARALDLDPARTDDEFELVVRSEALYLSQLVFAAVLILGMIVSLIAGTRQAR